MNEGYYLQEEMTIIMICNTAQDVELKRLSISLSTAQGNIISLGALATTVNCNAFAALTLANQKNWIIL